MTKGAEHLQINIRLYGPLEKYAGQPGLYRMEIMSGFSVEQLQDQLGVPCSSLGLIVINGIKRELDYRLEENAEVKFFPYVAGG